MGESHETHRAWAGGGFAGGDGARIGVIAFRAAASPLGEFLRARRGELVHLAGHLTIDRFRGEARTQFRLVDAADPQADRPL